jgi:ribosomal protein S18 acetylase RimI-like enzyme
VAVTVRRAEREDARAIAEVHVRSWRAAYRAILDDELLDGISVGEREGMWSRILREDGAWLNLVAADQGAVVGFCSVATPSRDPGVDPGTVEMGALYVDPPTWGAGTGSALLAASLERLAETGWRQATLWVLPENLAARAFYEKAGFRLEDGVESVEGRSGRRVIRFRREISPAGRSDRGAGGADRAGRQ